MFFLQHKLHVKKSKQLLFRNRGVRKVSKMMGSIKYLMHKMGIVKEVMDEVSLYYKILLF